MFALGLAGTIYLIVSDLDLRWKILAVALFGLGVTIGMASSLDDTSRLILCRAVHSIVALWGVIHWRQ